MLIRKAWHKRGELVLKIAKETTCLIALYLSTPPPTPLLPQQNSLIIVVILLGTWGSGGVSGDVVGGEGMGRAEKLEKKGLILR